jgi:hypothetical protein
LDSEKYCLLLHHKHLGYCQLLLRNILLDSRLEGPLDIDRLEATKAN